MPTDTTTSEDRIWETLEAELESLKVPVNAAIRAYPLPIPGCDAQYNHLLERRSAIAGELRRMREAREKGLAAADVVDTSPLLDPERKAALRQDPGA